MLFCCDMERFFVICYFLFVCNLFLFSFNGVDNADKVIMRIGDAEVYLSEFEFLYSDISRYKDCSKDDFFHYFSRFKLKAFDARRLGLDKNIDGTLRNAIIEEIISDSVVNQNIVNHPFAYLLTYRVLQNEDTCYGLKFMNEVYSKLESGIKVWEICDTFSDVRFFCEEIINQEYLLDEVKNEFLRNNGSTCSKPFISPEGVHILVKSDLEMLGYKDCVDDVLLASQWEKYYDEHLKKYRNEDLEVFFKENRKKYRWEFPHFKGAVIHCKNKRAARRIKKNIRKLPVEEWEPALEAMMRENSDYDALMETGLFQIGENVYVDKLVFKCGEYDKLEDYPYTFTFGKCLDYTPDSYKDVYEVLLQDYYLYHEEAYFENLERELRVEKYIDVLKTVNSDGSN